MSLTSAINSLGIGGDAKSDSKGGFLSDVFNWVDTNKDSIGNIVEIGDKVGLWKTDDVRNTVQQTQKQVETAYMKKAFNDYKPFIIGAGVIVAAFFIGKMLKK